MPKVSFVIPTWNGEAYLAETIESLLNQTMKDIEIIVVDDCSPDYTPVLMDWYTKKDERIKYHRLEENKGVCGARNFGNQVAESEVIAVSDHDDLSMKNRAYYSYLYMKNHPEVDCVTSDYHELNVDAVPVQKFKAPDMTRELFEKGEFVWMHSSACYRKKDILEIPYRDMSGSTDDWVFLEDWTKAGKKFKTVRHVLANCRRLPWGQMSQRRAGQGMGVNYYL